MICGRTFNITRAPHIGHFTLGRIVAKGFPQWGQRLVGCIEAIGVAQ
jgi:hypothetical protein